MGYGRFGRMILYLHSIQFEIGEELSERVTLAPASALSSHKARRVAGRCKVKSFGALPNQKGARHMEDRQIASWTGRLTSIHRCLVFLLFVFVKLRCPIGQVSAQCNALWRRWEMQILLLLQATQLRADGRQFVELHRKYRQLASCDDALPASTKLQGLLQHEIFARKPFVKSTRFTAASVSIRSQSTDNITPGSRTQLSHIRRARPETKRNVSSREIESATHSAVSWLKL